MIVSNRELANKSFSNHSTYTIPLQTNNLPTMDLLNNTRMDILKE